jgi:hypothetical protein
MRFESRLTTCNRRTLLRHLAMCAIMVASPGCSQQKTDKWVALRPPLFKARGRVIWNGEAAPGVLVVLRSQTFDVTATGLTNSQGEFFLSSYRKGDGAAAGVHSVTITKNVNLVGKDGSEALFNLMPLKYADPESSGFSVTIAEKNNNVLEFKVEGPQRAFSAEQP